MSRNASSDWTSIPSANDALDRLLTVSNGAGLTKFRYVGGTTQIAQARDLNNAVLYNVGTSLAGAARMDWGSGGTNQRFYGENGHGDLTWTAGSTGTITATLRSDPWGIPGASSGGSLPSFRFQGSWYDTSSALSWVVTRWYAPALGRFVSEDTLLGEPAAPASRHLLAYGGGQPISRWDPRGTTWCVYYDPCTTSAVYKGANPRRWSATFTPYSGVGIFRVDMFIKKKWESIGIGDLVPGIINLKGDWRGFTSGGWCLFSRACITINLGLGRVDVRVNPSCMKNRPLGIDDWDYWCNDANEINSWFPFRSAMVVYRSTYRDRTRGISAPMLHVSWSINDSAVLGLAPLDGYIDMVPPTARYPGHVKIWYEGYPSTGLYYKKTARSFSWGTVDQETEGPAFNLGSIVGDYTNKYEWPR